MTRGRTLPLAALLIFASSLVQVAAGPKLLATTHVQRTIEEVLCRLTDVREIEHLRLTESTERLRFDLRLTPEGQRVEYIRSVYLDVLGRDPMGKDCAGMRSWVEGGLTPEAVRRGIEAAPEGRRVAEVRRAFQEVLGRDPLDADNAALRYWVETSANADLIKEVLRTMRPQVGVYYFPWYAPSAAGWGNGSTVVPAGAPKPLLGWYSSNDADVLNVQIDQMERAGFDFVILDVPVGQSAIWENAKTFFEALRGRKLKAAVMLDDLYASPPAVKAEWVRQVILEFGNHPNYFYLPDGALIPLYSSPLDFSYPHVALRTVYWTARYGQGENTFNEQGFLHPRDWPFWAAPDTPLLNGLVPVTPGY
ncbi:MAG: hypothetical protein NTZ05_21095, partial [Chloroflexi bacterium]|nr:hypothetical protein [Chloroflexota bacterium]